MHRTSVFVTVVCLLVACRALAPTSQKFPVPVTISGFVQKGPFVAGALVTARALDTRLMRTGAVYTSATHDNAGAFVLDIADAPALVEIEATGNFFDELSGHVSELPVTLRAFFDPASETNVRINVLTSMTLERIGVLVRNGQDFAAARSQAEAEVLAAFSLGGLSSKPFVQTDLTDPDDGGAIGLAVTLTVMKAAAEEGADLLTFLSATSADFADDGVIGAPLREKFRLVQNDDMSTARENLSAYLSSVGAPSSLSAFEAFFDIDGDGVVDRDETNLALLSKEGAELGAVVESDAFTIRLPPLVPSATLSTNAGVLIVNGAAQGVIALVIGGDVVKLALPASSSFAREVRADLSLSTTTQVLSPGSFSLTTRSLQYFASTAFVARVAFNGTKHLLAGDENTLFTQTWGVPHYVTGCARNADTCSEPLEFTSGDLVPGPTSSSFVWWLVVERDPNLRVELQQLRLENNVLVFGPATPIYTSDSPSEEWSGWAVDRQNALLVFTTTLNAGVVDISTAAPAVLGSTISSGLAVSAAGGGRAFFVDGSWRSIDATGFAPGGGVLDFVPTAASHDGSVFVARKGESIALTTFNGVEIVWSDPLPDVLISGDGNRVFVCLRALGSCTAHDFSERNSLIPLQVFPDRLPYLDRAEVSFDGRLVVSADFKALTHVFASEEP